jgi:hypothetical protein
MAEGETVSAVAGSTAATELSTPAIAEPNNLREGDYANQPAMVAHSLAHP